MSRAVIRVMKRSLRRGSGPQVNAVQAAQAAEAALALLERSVRMRHVRLALQRLGDAVAVGARVPDEHWRYCREVATAGRNIELQQLFIASARAAHDLSREFLHG